MRGNMGATEAGDEIVGKVGGEKVSGHNGAIIVVGPDGETGVSEAVVLGKHVLDVSEAV
jgi:hypothetical protein